MDASELGNIIAEWARGEPLVVRAYIFGSRARGDYREDSDLDVAVEIRRGAGDENVLETWIFERKRMEERLAKLLPYKLQLENLDNSNTPTVLSGIQRSSMLVYEAMDGDAT